MNKSKKGLKITAGVLGGILVLYGILAVFPRPDNYPLDNSMRRKGELPILIANGGGNREFPDNTLEAFYNAYSVDPNVMMETDVSITKDGVVILSHDTTLDRKTNVTGAIADWNYSDLMAQKVDFGYTNPTDDDDRLCGEREHMASEKRIRLWYSAVFLILLILEVCIALFVSDRFIRPYGGDILVTVLLCAFFRTFFLHLPRLPLWVFLLALAMETGQYFDFVSLLGLG